MPSEKRKEESEKRKARSENQRHGGKRKLQQSKVKPRCDDIRQRYTCAALEHLTTWREQLRCKEFMRKERTSEVKHRQLKDSEAMSLCGFQYNEHSYHDWPFQNLHSDLYLNW